MVELTVRQSRLANLLDFRDMQPLILVVDDVEVNLRVVELMLARLGYRVDLVSSGAEALDRVSSVDYDAVLMDCNMPVMDGYATTRAIRELLGDRPLPIIALTAGDAHEHGDRRQEAGMDDVLPKPVMISSLQSMLQRWVPSGDGGDQPGAASPNS